MRSFMCLTLLGLMTLVVFPGAQVSKFAPVTREMLENPSPDDWLMYSRTYDAQRYQPAQADQPAECRPVEDRVDQRAGHAVTSRAFRSYIAA